jgi:hypothetical protein
VPRNCVRVNNEREGCTALGRAYSPAATSAPASYSTSDATISCQAGGDLVLFFRKEEHSGLRWRRVTRPSRKGQEPAPKWRRNLLESLKMDSDMASRWRRAALVGKENRSGEVVCLGPSCARI